MRATPYSILAAGVIAVSFFAPSVAAGQSATGATRIGGLVGGSLGADHSASTVAVSVGHRFAPRLAVEGDLSYFSDLTLAEFTRNGVFSSWHARTTSATANLTYTLPSGVRWLRPYIAAGGGAARVRRDVRDPAFCPCPPRTYIKPVFAGGGGVDFLVWREVAVGLDVRYQRVFEDERLYRPNLRNLKRVGTFISYRF